MITVNGIKSPKKVFKQGVTKYLGFYKEPDKVIWNVRSRFQCIYKNNDAGCCVSIDAHPNPTRKDTWAITMTDTILAYAAVRYLCWFKEPNHNIISNYIVDCFEFFEKEYGKIL